MKKIVSVYLIILFGLFVVLTLLDQGSDYIVEKKVWKVLQQQIDIARDPNVIPDHTFEKVISAYQKIIDKHPQSRLTPGLYIHIGEVYAMREDYKGARKIYNELIKLYPDDRELSAEAMFKVGKTYEVTNNWLGATKVYQNIIQDYPLTNVGLNTPLYIANYYKDKNDYQKTMVAYEVAVRHYIKIATDHNNTHVGLNAMRHLSTSYLDQIHIRCAIQNYLFNHKKNPVYGANFQGSIHQQIVKLKQPEKHKK